VALEDPLAETRGEALDLRLDLGRGIAAVAGRDMRVGVERMHIAARAPRVGQILLADQDEGPLGHPSSADVAFGGGDVLQRAADVNGAGAA
jgi:hypothetical protein